MIRSSEGRFLAPMCSIRPTELTRWKAPSLLRIIERALVPDGLALLHTIGRKTERKVDDRFFTTYVFPGCALPSLAGMTADIDDRFVVEDVHNFSADYDRTLMAWHERFVRCWDRFEGRLGAQFFRMWEYYLLASAGSFRSRHQQLYQLVLSPQGVRGGYRSVR